MFWKKSSEKIGIVKSLMFGRIMSGNKLVSKHLNIIIFLYS